MKPFIAAVLLGILGLPALLRAEPEQKFILVGYLSDSSFDGSVPNEIRDQSVAAETLFAAHGRWVTFGFVALKGTPPPVSAKGEIVADEATMAWAANLEAANPQVDYIILATSRPIRFERKGAGIKVSGLAAAFHLYSTKVCLMNMWRAPRNCLAHEFTHYLGYPGDAVDGYHSTHEENLMAAVSLNQWLVDEKTLRLWDEFIPLTCRNWRKAHEPTPSAGSRLPKG